MENDEISLIRKDKNVYINMPVLYFEINCNLIVIISYIFQGLTFEIISHF